MSDLVRLLTDMQNGWTRLRPERPPMFADYVLKHGRHFTSKPLSARERSILDTAMRVSRCSFPIKQCFSNSMRVVISDVSGRARYVEGYCIARAVPFPIHHGWIEIGGKVVDLTLRPHAFGEFPEHREYYGCVFTTDEVAEFVLETGTAGSLLDDPQRDYRVLRAAFPDWTVSTKGISP